MNVVGRKNTGKYHWGWLAFGVLCLIAVGLFVAIVVLANPPKRVDWNELEERLSVVDYGDIDVNIAIYQEFIDATSDRGDLVDLLEKRLNYLMSVDVEMKHGGTAIADAIGIDDILQSVSSAGQVINVTASYGDMDLCKKYIKIMAERQGPVSEEVIG